MGSWTREKSKLGLGLRLGLWLGLWLLATSVQGQQTGTGKIPIQAARWYQLTNSPDGIEALFDGATNVNVANGYGRVINTFDSYYPLRAGETFNITSIRFFDGWGSNAGEPMTLSILTDSWQRIPIATFTGTRYGWVGPYPNRPGTFTLDAPVANARYLVLTSSWAYPTEIELYGAYALPAPLPVPDPAALAAGKHIALRQALGVNAFEWDLLDPAAPSVVDPARLAAVQHFGGMRHYIDWEKLESHPGSYTFNPVHSGSWNYDAIYEKLKSEGVEVLACLKTLPDWLQATYPPAERDNENVPVRYGQSFALPASYREQAQLAFQFAGRYGSNAGLDRRLLRVSTAPPRWTGDPVNQVKVGLHLIRYMECDNERDKWWKGRKAYQTPYEYAANLSAFYDGHKNTLGPGWGVKNADPSMQVVMGGLASPSPDYVKGMIDWCRQHRGYKANGQVDLCWDVINYHYYANNAGTSQGGNSTRGSAPEVSGAGAVAQAFVRMAHEYAGGMPVWMSETGYDLHPGSPLKAVAVGSRSVLETQADWTLRTALSYARWGVERVFLYQLYDDNGASPVQFGSMGLINGDKTPRLAAQYLRQAGQLLGSYTYAQTLASEPVVDRYERGQSAYALVVPDERGRTAGYTLALGGTAYADVYRPRAGSGDMAVERVAVVGGQLALQLSETPLFVVPVPSSATPPPVVANCAATGTILREQWNNVAGLAVANIPLNTAPTSTSQLSQFESPSNLGDNYGARIRGYVCAPQTGAYTFWIAGDDNCELWLSADDNPANKVRIARVEGHYSQGQGHTGARQWYKYATQQSGPLNLVAGRRYYIEALHKEYNNGDNLAVAWRLPGGTMEEPIPGRQLSPFVETSTPSCTATGTILREQWNNVAGLAVANIPLNTAPTSTSQLSQFESPSNLGDNYGARIRGYVCAPQTGAYTFWIAGDDNCELWLSPDDNPANKVRIARVEGHYSQGQGHTGARQWYKYATQQSGPLNLVAGRRYYIEALHKEYNNGDNLAVAWRLPGGTMEEPIPGRQLSPYVEVAGRGASIAATSSVTLSSTRNEAAAQGVTLTAYPNPFSHHSQVQCTLPTAGRATLTLYDVQGRLVRTLFQGVLAAQQPHTLVLSAQGLPAGIYSLQLISAQGVLHQRVVLTK